MPGPGAQPPKRLAPGDVVAGKWVVERTLGMGGMGQVVAARHAKLGTHVAIKVVHPELVLDDQVVARFLREAHAMARLKSEHTVRVLDMGETEANVPYLIMEHLEGRDLGAVLLDRGPLPVAVALEYARQAAEALAEAHAAGIVHRDVKPGNLFLSKRGSGAEVVRVLDFGLAKAVTASHTLASKLTQSGDVLGTPHYMAPEQLLGRDVIDARADIWGLGATLYRLLTRAFPFAADNAALSTQAILRGEPVPMKGVRPDLPDHVVAVVTRCLRKDPNERFATMEELGAALAQSRAVILTPRLGPVTPVTPFPASRPAAAPEPAAPAVSRPAEPTMRLAPTPPATVPRRPAPYAVIGISAVLAMLGLGLVGATVLRRHAQPATPPSTATSVASAPSEGPAPAPAASPPEASARDAPAAASVAASVASAVPTSSAPARSVRAAPTAPRATSTARRPSPASSNAGAVYDSL